MQIVPFTSDYAQTFVVQLYGVKFRVDARWNERSQSWTFDLTVQSDGTRLLSGVPLLVGQDVLAPYGLRIGGMIPSDLSGTSSDAGPEDLGSRVIVASLSSAELDFLAKSKFPGVVSPGPFPPSPTPAAPGSVAAGGTGAGAGTLVVFPSGGGGGGTGGGGGGITIANGQFFSDMRLITGENTGVELLVMQFVMNAGIDSSLTLALLAGFMASSLSGTAHVRFYLGGTFGTLGTYGVPDGTLVADEPITSATLGPAYATGTPIPNPGGLIPVKVTLQSSGGAGTDAAMGGLSGVVG